MTGELSGEDQPASRDYSRPEEAAEQAAAMALIEIVGPHALRREARPIGTVAVEVDGIDLLLPPAVPTPSRRPRTIKNSSELQFL